MQISKLSLIFSLAAAAAWQVHAQSASPDLQNKALELLRQTIAKEQAQSPSVKPSPRSSATPNPTAPTAVPAARPAAPSTPLTAAPGSNDAQQQASQLLRQKMAEQEPASTAAAKAAPVKTNKTATSKAPAKSTTPSGPTTAAIRPATNAAPAAPEQPAGPKTKQQRLMDLLELYKADKITPAQYHAERAKILAEP